MMVLQVREDGKSRVYDGNWATLDGILRLDLGDGQVSSSGYEVLGNLSENPIRRYCHRFGSS